jgi:hypothetical protein
MEILKHIVDAEEVCKKTNNRWINTPIDEDTKKIFDCIQSKNKNSSEFDPHTNAIARDINYRKKQVIISCKKLNQMIINSIEKDKDLGLIIFKVDELIDEDEKIDEDGEIDDSLFKYTLLFFKYKGYTIKVQNMKNKLSRNFKVSWIE